MPAGPGFPVPESPYESQEPRHGNPWRIKPVCIWNAAGVWFELLATIEWMNVMLSTEPVKVRGRRSLTHKPLASGLKSEIEVADAAVREKSATTRFAPGREVGRPGARAGFSVSGEDFPISCFFVK